MKRLIILLVDDDIDDKEMFCEAVKEISKSHECIWAKNGYEALDLLNAKSVKPDYIFLDINMPLLNGKQSLAKIKASENLQNIPVYMYSTSSQDRDRSEMLTLGADGFITKPDNYKELVNILASIFLHNK
jgi:DNA-binding response OmpR family regulator